MSQLPKPKKNAFHRGHFSHCVLLIETSYVHRLQYWTLWDQSTFYSKFHFYRLSAISQSIIEVSWKVNFSKNRTFKQFSKIFAGVHSPSVITSQVQWKVSKLKSKLWCPEWCILHMKEGFDKKNMIKSQWSKIVSYYPFRCIRLNGIR